MTGDELLFEACKKGQLKAVNELVDRVLVFKLKPKANVNAKDGDGFTPLYFAVRDGHRDVARKLIDKGANVDVKDKSGFTPLYYATRQGHREIVRLLVARGADVNAKDKSGFTPLHYATRDGYLEIARFLMSKGAEINPKDAASLAPVAASRATKPVATKTVDSKAKDKAKEKGKVSPVSLDEPLPKAKKELAKPPVNGASHVSVLEKGRASSQRGNSEDTSGIPIDKRLSKVNDVNVFIFDERDSLLAGKRRRDDSTAVVWDLLTEYNLFRGLVVCDHIEKSRAILTYATGEDGGGLPNMVGEICRTPEGATLVIGGDLRSVSECWFNLVELLSKRHKELGIIEASFFDMIGETSIIIEKSPSRRLTNIGRALGSRNSKLESMAY
jgi:hypothetical protein